MINTPAYIPNAREAKGVQTFSRPAMSVICDVCNTTRTRGNHERCAQMRQAAGFTTNQKRRADASPCRSLDNAEGGTPDNNIHPDKPTSPVGALESCSEAVSNNEVSK
ncbi:hypothetical protein [Pseudomonas sp.]|uniref:hypothetical protein n=1 Tax=Pseudomonas sp. TaxID=306 RepID=UPI0028AA0DE4|nr:hypothetical protein [Pseudomonas sp.]